MQLKRGWWRTDIGDEAFVVGEHNGIWYGVLNMFASSWYLDGQGTDSDTQNLVGPYLGDGPEPVEPVQVCLGWWERRDGDVENIVQNTGHPSYPWASARDLTFADDGKNVKGRDSQSDLVKRRPDLDQPKPDAKDAEIERLLHVLSGKDVQIEKLERSLEERCEKIDDLRNQLRDARNNADRWCSSYNNLKANVAEMASKIEDLIE